MSDIDHARLMLKMAHKDLKALAGMMDDEDFVDEILGTLDFDRTKTLKDVT